MTFLSLTETTTAVGMGNWPIVKQVAWVFGFIMQGIFIVLSGIGIENIGVYIIVFTIITKMLLLPITIKQQKFSKMNAIISPELQAIQKKYAGRKDQASVQKMQMEQQQLYDKYGTSMTAGCLPSLIQMPIICALYPVIADIKNYVPQLATYSAEQYQRIHMFLGINLLEAPGFKLSFALIIPILAGVFSFLSMRLTMQNQPSMGEGQMANSMKTMNNIMPLFSVFMGITLPAFLGLYWCIQYVVMIVQQLFINQYMKKVSIEELIKKNIEKTNKKRARKGLPPLSDKANVNTKNIKRPITANQNRPNLNKDEKGGNSKDSTEYYQNKSAKPGSLAAKANMVKDYNNKSKK